jgi:GTP pyrophosphokinase
MSRPPQTESAVPAEPGARPGEALPGLPTAAEQGAQDGAQQGAHPYTSAAEAGAVPPPDIEHTHQVRARSRPGLDRAAITLLQATAVKHFPEAGPSGMSSGELIARAAARLEAAPEREATDVDVGVRAALALAEMKLDAATLAATLIVAVPSALAGPDIAEELGAEVATLVEGSSRLGKVRWDRLEDERVETLRKMFLAMARDIRVVLIVLALRRECMLRADGASPEEAQRLARETLAVHAPLANRLGIWQFKWQLEDASFRLLSPDAYSELARALSDTHERREAFIALAVALLREKLAEEQIGAEVSGRPKHVYSIHKKMQRKRVSFEQIHDISAVRVITERVQNCYTVLGIVHSI